MLSVATIEIYVLSRDMALLRVMGYALSYSNVNALGTVI